MNSHLSIPFNAIESHIHVSPSKAQGWRHVDLKNLHPTTLQRGVDVDQHEVLITQVDQYEVVIYRQCEVNSCRLIGTSQ